LKEIKSINRNKLPKILLMENVKALLNKEFREDLEHWIKTLEEI
jgi:DNA (cytosine-5)-methyltransferase 1